MNKNKFIEELRAHLHLLPKVEVDSAVSFYSELFDDAQDEGELARELGSTAQIAKGIIGEYAEQNPGFDAGEKQKTPPPQYRPPQAKPRMGGVEILVLILTFPLWVPVVAVAFALMLVVAILITVIPAVLFISFLAGGIWLLIGAIMALFISPIYAVYNVGKALILLGLCVLLLSPGMAAIKGVAAYCVKFVQNVVDGFWRNRR